LCEPGGCYYQEEHHEAPVGKIHSSLDHISNWNHVLLAEIDKFIQSVYLEDRDPRHITHGWWRQSDVGTCVPTSCITA
jgi:hypothetical protein